MHSLFIYLIKVNASLIVFYLCYKLFFQRDTFWKIRRWYLITSIFFSFVYPLISMEGWLKKQEPVMNAIAAIQLDEIVVGQVSKPTIFTVENIMWGIFLIVGASLFFRMLTQLVSIIRRRIKGVKTTLQKMEIIRMSEKLTPFSFFKWIFINPDLHNETETAEILVHERTHAQQWHSIDMVISQLQTLFCWINPAAWLMEREIRHNLEFLADNQVIKSGFEPKRYQYHLLQLTYEPADSKLANNFNVLPIKKRIKMMNTKRTKKTGLLKYTMIIPLALAMLVASNVQDMMAAAKKMVENITITDQEKTLQLQEALEYDNQAKTTAKDSQDRAKQVQTVQFTAPKIKKDVKKSKQMKQTMQFTVPKIKKDANINENGDYQTSELVVVGYGIENNPANASGVTVVGYGNNNQITKQKDDPKVFENVEQPPVFKGGDAAMYEWLNKNINYPAQAFENNIQGNVVCQFVIGETGKIESVVVARHVDPLLDAEAVRVIKSMPDWIPGKQGGQTVNVRYTLPVRFKLNTDEKKTKDSQVKIEIKDYSNNTEKPVFDTPPTFTGGEKAMYEFMNKNINYPIKASENNIKGNVIVKFIVDQNGNIVNPKIVKSVDPTLDAEALRFVKSMPKWKSATLKGKNVTSEVCIPIKFCLNK